MSKTQLKKSADTSSVKKAVLQAQQISIDSFRLVKGSVDSDDEFDQSLILGFQVNYDFQMGFILKEEKVRSIFKVQVRTESGGKQTREAEGTFVFHYHFSVGNLKELATPDSSGLIKVNPDLANAIASVTYSTTRGILMARMQSTALQDFILPVVNPNDVAKSGIRK